VSTTQPISVSCFRISSPICLLNSLISYSSLRSLCGVPRSFELHVSHALSLSLYFNFSRSRSFFVSLVCKILLPTICLSCSRAQQALSNSCTLCVALSRVLLSQLSKRGRATSLQTCIMWNAHERRSDKYHQSTRMLTNFRTVCRVPGADIHSVATCFHVMVDGPPTENNKIIHRHNYSLPHGRCLGPCGGHILASGKPRSAIYQQPSALKNLLGAEPMVPGSIQKISLQKHCKKKCW